MDEIEIRWMKKKDSTIRLQFRNIWEGNYGQECGEWSDVPTVDERELPINLIPKNNR